MCLAAGSLAASVLKKAFLKNWSRFHNDLGEPMHRREWYEFRTRQSSFLEQIPCSLRQGNIAVTQRNDAANQAADTADQSFQSFSLLALPKTNPAFRIGFRTAHWMSHFRSFQRRLNGDWPGTSRRGGVDNERFAVG